MRCEAPGPDTVALAIGLVDIARPPGVPTWDDEPLHLLVTDHSNPHELRETARRIGALR